MIKQTDQGRLDPPRGCMSRALPLVPHYATPVARLAAVRKERFLTGRLKRWRVALRKEAHFHHCCPTSCSTNSTEN